MSVCDKLKLKRYPMVVPMPLGTANDMSRVLRWGNNFTSASSSDVEDFVQNVKDGVRLKMDRWHLRTSPLAADALRQLRADYGFAATVDVDNDDKEDDAEDEKEFQSVTIQVDEDSDPEASGAAISSTDQGDSVKRKKSSPNLDGPSLDKEYVVNNYFSIGFDSQVMLDFHEQRHSSPGLFVHPVVNKAVVGVHGMSAGFKNLTSPALHKFVYFEVSPF